ncbi:MAG: DUF3703 domain-containing protein [Bacteroidia bacterium]|jgi:hypothetical protein|nr:DUF3703 domain-containing protein [Chitinophagaceae bacterium]MBP7715629.1 DUF3703 domain-containing protein [Bacteroidia bacterium]MBK8301618.1 DUF3703 domain-containing protein [Chitinophagaceae bacterium]MBP6416979.1 DUF3703 domain-containing protein [Chitinophagaceae bacterium]MBP8115182.1 DUF3703 domain-containing protein [Chitinophagaceae bacterium]
MKFYTAMPKTLKPFYQTELNKATTLLQQGKLQECWRHYERAHILGQRYPLQHSYVHWLMLKFGIKIKSTKEVLGQITRLVFGGVKSFVGTVPIGNTGGANVPPLKQMEIPEDLAAIINNTKTN